MRNIKYFIKKGQCYMLLFRKWTTNWKTGKKVFPKAPKKVLAIPKLVDCSYCGCC